MKRYTIDLVVLLFPVLVALVVYPMLPSSIPMQWHWDGSARYAAKSRILLIALLPFVIYEYSKFKRSR